MTGRLDLTMNHVALSMQAEELDGGRRREVVRFYEDVFGWTEYRLDDDYVRQFAVELSSLLHEDVPSLPPLVLLTGRGAFVFLYGLREPGRPSPADHFGFEVESEAELDEVLERARAAARVDPDVKIVDKSVTTSEIGEGLEGRAPGERSDLVNCYISYRLPLAVEVQYYRRGG
jgi:hypothetical protein